MRILLIANYLPDAQQSMQGFSAALYGGLMKVGHDVRMIRPPAIAGKLHHLPGGKWLGYVDKFLMFPALLVCALRWADVVHVCDHSNAIYVPLLTHKPNVVTCHDLTAIRSALGEIPSHHTRWSGRRLQQFIRYGLTRAQHIACASNTTASHVSRITGAEPGRCSRIYHSVIPRYTPMAPVEAANRISGLGLGSGKFILHIGGNQWYKNRAGVLRIFSLVNRRQEFGPIKLVMAGKPWTKEMHSIVRQEGIGSSVVELTAVSEEDLRALYSRAELLLFPSLEEGFGLPIAEAQSCGCPVVTSNRAPMTEVGGDGAIYMDPLDYNSGADAVLLGLKESPRLRKNGLRNAVQFGREEMISAYSAIYETVYSHLKLDSDAIPSYRA